MQSTLPREIATVTQLSPYEWTLLTILIKKHKRRRQKTNDKLSWVSTPLWVPINSPACPRQCLASLGQYPVAGSMSPLFRARATHHITSHLTSRPRSHQEEEKQSCEYKSKKATVWPRYPESTSCQRWDPLSPNWKSKLKWSVRYPSNG